MKGLTTRQKEMLEFIQLHFSDKGYWPSIRDIQKYFGFKSTNAVMGHLRALESTGSLSRMPGQARTFRLSAGCHIQPKGQEVHTSATVSLPIYGSIAAGYPDRVESSGAMGTLQIDASTANITDRSKSFALKVRGESMVDAGIYDGDLVIVEPGEPKNNDVVVALVDGESTLKRFIKKPQEPAYLKAENIDYPDIVPFTELLVQGIARSIVRCL